MKKQIICLAALGLLFSGQLLAVNIDGLSKEDIYNNFKTAYEQQNFTEAREWVRALIRVKEEEYGQDSPELVVTLINLTQMDIELSDWVNAQDNGARALEIADSSADVNHTTRMAAMMALAQAHLGRRDKRRADEVLRMALKANKKQKEVDLFQQGDICQMQMQTAKLYRDDIEKAYKSGNKAVNCMLKAHEAAFGKDSVELVITYHDAAEWFRFSTQLARERKMRKKALELLTAAYGEDDPRLATDIRAVAYSYMIQRKKKNEVARLIQQAVNLRYPDDVGGRFSKARALIDQGDYHLLYENPADGIQFYIESWNLMANEPSIGPDQANEYFQEVKELYFKMPEKPANQGGKGLYYVPNGFVEVEFTVTESGTVEDIDIIRSSPVDMQESLFKKAYRGASFRPRIYMGKAVATENVSQRLNYQGEYDVEFRR